MTIKHKILLGYIKDLSVETPDPESLIAARENISKYSLNLDLNSKILKNKMIEVYTKLTYEDKTNKKKIYLEMNYATVVRIERKKKGEVKKSREERGRKSRRKGKDFWKNTNQEFIRSLL